LRVFFGGNAAGASKVPASPLVLLFLGDAQREGSVLGSLILSRRTTNSLLFSLRRGIS